MVSTQLPSRRLPVECDFSPDGLFEARFRVENTSNLREGEQLPPMNDCIFCQIIQGQAPASMVYQDELAVAFLDIHPINPGDTLVVPRKHVVDMFEADEALVAHLFTVARRLMDPIRQVSGCPAMNIIVANGPEAHQDVFHLHIHLTPRRRGDRFVVRFPPDWPPPLERAQLDRVAAQIRQALSPP